MDKHAFRIFPSRKLAEVKQDQGENANIDENLEVKLDPDNQWLEIIGAKSHRFENPIQKNESRSSNQSQDHITENSVKNETFPKPIFKIKRKTRKKYKNTYVKVEPRLDKQYYRQHTVEWDPKQYPTYASIQETDLE